MNKISVECYAGYKGEQSPRRFTLGAHAFDVVEMEDQWYGPSAQFFKARADDGNSYILRYDNEQDCWTLEAFRRR
jgi:hypothetical protein